ncbi:MAG: LuxR C-terminal-related transcriptional regulator [Nocardioides sp.]
MDDEDGVDLLDAVLAVRPGLVVLDLDLRRRPDGMRLLPGLTGAGVPSVVITASPALARWGEALLHGAVTVLAKSTALPDVLRVLRDVSDGKVVMPARQRAELVERHLSVQADRGRLMSRFEHLTGRERHVLAGLVAGHRLRQIAEAATVTEATVRTQVRAILVKLGVGSPLAAVSMARRVGWEPPGHERADDQAVREKLRR